LLTGKAIPSWVNRLATICVRFPLLAACIPKEWLTPDGGIGLIDLKDWEEIDYPDDADEADENITSPTTTTTTAKNITSPALRLKKKTEGEEELDGFGDIGVANNVFVHKEEDDDKISLTQMLDELNKKSHSST